MFEIILLIALIVLAVLLVRANAQINALKNSGLTTEKSPEEPTYGIKNLTGDFSGTMLLDPLTQLPAREAFNDRLTQALHQSKRFEKSFGIILLDVNEFKVINQTQGDDVGDKLLIEISVRLQKAIRQIDTMTRYAGDTFIFLLPELSLPETAAYVAQRLLDFIVEPFHINEKEIFLTANIGVAIFPNDGADEKTLLQNATDALNQAKVSGKGRYQFYHQELHALGQRELALNSLISNPDVIQKLVMNYQPIVNVVTGKVEGVHAIPCLTHPELGSVSFMEYAKIAENNKKIIPIGEWTLRNAIQQFNKWHTEGFKPESIVINVTLSQIRNPQFIYNVSKIMEENNIDPEKIIFEVAEKNLFANTSSLEKAFEMLSQVGIQIALSVIALGHFALQKITKLPIKFLKIDAKLTVDNKMSQENEMVLHMIVMLAKDMNVNIMADGVDTEKQKDLLKDLGCELMQGKLFGGILPVTDVSTKGGT